MLLPLLLVLQGTAAGSGARPASEADMMTVAAAARRYDGRKRELRVAVPRADTAVVVDGALDEPVWQEAAVLHGFSQFAPTDGVAAADSTEVLVWYSPTAIHFGIRAFEAHGSVHATLADRDRIGSDDHLQILLGTFNDGRQAAVFGVNPFGVQMDGALVETGRVSGNGFNQGTVVRETPDLSPDYVFQSKGRLVPGGYEIEVRIPFKSLRFQPGREQTWGVNVVRRVQHSGAEDTWAPARRAAASFLGQSGQLAGLTDLKRGLVLDLNPELTSSTTGAPTATGYEYSGGGPQLGGNVRWGITNNLNLNGTVNPDFSQVESDAGQLGFDPRQALFFPEKRPFFLDGIELFDTPNRLIYTRSIVQPVAAAKLTGKAFGTDVALLSAMDDRDVSPTGDHPVYNILRVQHGLGRASRLGLAYTDRVDGDAYNRVAGVDGRLVFGGAYAAQFQVAGSRTRVGGVTTNAPLWQARLDNNGRTFGFRTSIIGIDEEFVAGSGFITRPGIVNARLAPRATLYGRPDAPVQRFTGEVALDGTWQYEKFVGGEGIQDQKLHFNANATLRGGWNVGASLLVEQFGYDSALYANYALEVPRPGGATEIVPFTGQPTIDNLDWVVSFGTPQFKRFDANVFALVGNDENFDEWASGRLVILNAGLNWRPTDQLRAEVTYNWQQVDRRTDGSTVSRGRIPRLKLEYQVSRPFFVRLIGEYQSVERDSLRDDSRTGAPILICEPGLVNCVRPARLERNTFRADLLFAYQPVPGTVVFAGYGSTMQEPRAMRFNDLRRVRDGFFVKMSYLFRM